MDMEERLTRLETQSFAYGCIARLLLVKSAMGNPDGLARLREQVCTGIEHLYNERLTHRGHRFLQMAIGEAEDLLAAPGDPKPRHDL